MPGPRQPSALTPEYLFDSRLGKTGRYVDASSGRMVPVARINAAMEARIAAGQANIRVLSEQLQQGSITLAQWQVGMRQEIKTLHTMAGAIGKGGWAQMSQGDWGAVGQLSRSQYRFLQNFAIEIEQGKQKLNGHFKRRADMYAQASRGTQSRMEGREAGRNGATEERRVRYAADSCDDCIRYEAMGWQPIGTLPAPGEASACRTNCRCTKEWR